jgi:hypothetical protein
MKRIRHPHRVVEVRGQPGPVGVGEVDRHRLDADQPVRPLGRAPTAQIRCGVAFRQVDQDPGVGIDQTGGEAGAVMPVGLEERGLIHPQRRHRPDPVRVLDHRGVMG